eukprot:scaffold74775_cov68-Phaeocystis_antarctica.AAC.1
MSKKSEQSEYRHLRQGLDSGLGSSPRKRPLAPARRGSWKARHRPARQRSPMCTPMIVGIARVALCHSVLTQLSDV